MPWINVAILSMCCITANSRNSDCRESEISEFKGTVKKPEFVSLSSGLRFDDDFISRILSPKRFHEKTNPFFHVCLLSFSFFFLVVQKEFLKVMKNVTKISFQFLPIMLAL